MFRGMESGWSGSKIGEITASLRLAFVSSTAEPEVPDSIQNQAIEVKMTSDREIPKYT